MCTLKHTPKGPGLNLSLTHASHIQRVVTTVKSEHATMTAVANAVSRTAASQLTRPEHLQLSPPHLI